MEKAAAAGGIVTASRGAAENMATTTMEMKRIKAEHKRSGNPLFFCIFMSKKGGVELFLRDIGLRDTITLPQMEAGGQV